MRRIMMAAMMAVLLMTLGAGVASAGVENRPNTETFMLVCDGQEVEVVAPAGDNENNPLLQIVGSNSVLVFQHIEFTFTALDPETREVLFQESDTFDLGKGMKKGLQDDLVTCTTFGEFFLEDEGIIAQFSAEGQALMTPRGR